MRRRRSVAVVATAALTSGALVPAIVVGGAGAAAAAVPSTIHAAAYLGADALDETSLPATIGDGDQPVEWDLDADAFAAPYATVEVEGTVGGDGTDAGETVTGEVEVLPPSDAPLTYFVDAGHNGDSQDRAYSDLLTDSRAFTGAITLATDLHNDLPDQAFVDGENDWGYTFGGSNNYKISVPGGDPDPADAETLASYDKYELGVRTNGSQIGYRLALDPGTYTLSSGFYEFYAGSQARYRVITPTVSYTLDGEAESDALDQADLVTDAGATTRLLVNSAFTIPEGATDVALTYVSTSGEAPSLSWFAIAQGDVAQTLDDAAGTSEPDPDDPDTVDVTVDAADIAADNVNGLTFKGFGVLSGNSSSAVLMDYKSEHPEEYAHFLEVLFGGDRPLIDHVKIEMGDDRNNSTGSDPATMRLEDEPANVARAPGFQLAADAAKLNPDLRVSILRWNAPAWADTNDKIYTWYKNTILAAYREYGYMVDYVNPGVNEHSADLGWTQEFADRVKTDDAGYVSDDASLAGFRDGEAELFHEIKTVISDEVGTGTFGDEMVADADLREAVDVAAFHYNTNDDGAGNFKRLAQELDTEVWNSEAQATFSNTSFRQNNNVADPTVEGTGLGGTGSALEMANTVVKGFVNSNRTHFIYQPAIGSFFEGGQYSFKELVSARDPWSGWMHYDAGLAVLQHFADFSEAGWENDDNTAGIWRAVPEASMTTASGTNPVDGRNGEPNYMTLAAPDASDFTTVVVNDSEKTKTYRITPASFTFDEGTELGVWETRGADDGQAFDANYKRHVADVAADADGAYTVTVEPYSIVSITSLDVTTDESWTTPLPVEGERTVLDLGAGEGGHAGSSDGVDADVLWQDGYDYTDRTVPVIGDGGGLTDETEGFVDSRGGPTGTIPLYTWDRNGGFEAVETDDSGWVLRQQVDRETTGIGGAWNGGDPVTAVGDRRWTNYEAGVDVRFPDEGTANYAALGARSSGGGGSANLGGTAYALTLSSDGAWQLQRMGRAVDSGSVADDGWDGSAWHRLTVRAVGADITASIDGDEVASYTDTDPYRSGWVDLGSSFDHTEFDDLTVTRVADDVPYYGEYLDDLETNDLGDPPSDVLVYAGDWAHANGKGMYQYMRSTSTTSQEGASVAYTFTGSGLDLIGANGGTATLDVTVDGEPVEVNAATHVSGDFQAMYSLRGLPWGEHTVTVSLASGTLVLDAVGVVSEPADEPASGDALDALATALADAEEVTRDDDFTDETWGLLQTAIAMAREAVDDPASYRLDVEGAAALTQRLENGSSPLAYRITALADVSLATPTGDAPGLPETLAATLDDGTTRDVPVTWDVEEASFDEDWATVSVAGGYGSATTTAQVEVVPAGTTFFADLNGTQDVLGEPSPAFTAISGLLGDQLVNDAPDQKLGGDATWGHFGTNAAGADEVYGKGVVAGPYSKLTTTGIYTANQVGAQVGYTVDLPAGDYTITAGSHSWWAGNARSADVLLTHDGGTSTVDSITLDTATPSRVLSYDVELAEDGPLTIALEATNTQSPMLSWVGVVAADVTDPEPVEVVPAVSVSQPVCEDGAVVAGSISGSAMDGVARYVVKEWVDGAAGGYSSGEDLAAGDYVVRAWPAEGVTLTPGQGWESIFKGRVQTVVTIDAVDCVGPKVTVKGGDSFTVGADGTYSKVSFKLFDAGKVDRLTLNGKVKDLTDNVWSDLNFVAPGKFGAVEGANTLVVFDVAGNSTTVEFTLTTA
ncbi:hypothetical protein GCM10025865_13090 [Paraoerskovia sediminicola]|uniref:Uncharacterized protein n=1 Tax=Paraoerskovia sediminicola TaxID=1138587 RepID=A0ABM8G1X1_9CELL|nr:Ig-like domain-containing protein [Paraoerskovia sediminicola]BDZ42010.1 hypothetical protein GCM10025865_13090 [Paraoerskovia sediminicola]